jgi:hypothetical protein
MHRFVLLFVGVAALLSGWAIAEAQARTNGWDQLFASDPYLPVIWSTSLGLWILAAVAVATREVRRSMARQQAEQTERIIAANRQIVESNEKLVEIVRECADALLRDADQRKREEINSMLAEYDIPTKSRNEKVTDVGGSTQNRDPQNLISFRRQRTSGDG